MGNPIKKFYEAFEKLDAEGMVAQYADDVVFSDPAFGTLHGERAKNMWRMLCASQKEKGKGKGFKVQSSNIVEDENGGTAHWEAWYIFSQTGRSVHNKIDAKITVVNGKITKHVDEFDSRAWASQAMGFKGWLLGGTSFFRKKLNASTNALLDKWEAKQK